VEVTALGNSPALSGRFPMMTVSKVSLPSTTDCSCESKVFLVPFAVSSSERFSWHFPYRSFRPFTRWAQLV